MTKVTGKARTTRVTMSDVAEMAGVSVASVSNALNDRPGLSPQVRSRILAVADGMGYRANTLAQELRKGHSKTIGLSVVDLSNPFYADLSQGVIRTAASLGFAVFLSNVGADSKSLQGVIDGFRDRNLGGMLFTSLTNADAHLLRDLQRDGIPFVKLVRDVQGISADWVGIDDYAGGVELGEHLGETGHRNVACVGGPLDSNASAARVNGIRVGLAHFGVTLRNEASEELHGLPTRQSGHDRARRMLDAHRDLDCLVGGNDIIALGILDACRALGREVPSRVSVAGFDNMTFASVGPLQLTTVNVPREEIGAIGAQFLIERMQGQNPEPRKKTLPHKLYERDSTIRI